MPSCHIHKKPSGSSIQAAFCSQQTALVFVTHGECPPNSVASTTATRSLVVIGLVVTSILATTALRLAGIELRHQIFKRCVAGKCFLLRILEGVHFFGWLEDLAFTPTAATALSSAAAT